MTIPMLLIPSCLCGVLVGIFVKSGKLGFFLSGFLPWFGLLCFQLFMEYVMPYRGGGASFWPIAQIIAGTPMAIVGFISFGLTYFIRGNVK